MSLIRTFTVTVANPGAGNRYYIDGVLQETVTLAEGYTYRFDVSDSSMGSHPFKFSTTSNGTHNGGSEYTTGVTTSGTTGQTDAYVQITVAASAPQLYYYCQYHSGMGGSANTEPSDTWGLLQWSQNSWGSQDENIISLTGVSFSSEIGTVIAGSEEGWGADAWGDNTWGENAINVSIDGLSMSAALGPEGWGINSFGDGQWGGEFTFKPESIIVPTGQTASAALGSATIGRLDMIFSISSPGTIGVGLGTPSINNGADHQQGLASFSTPAAVGSVTATPNTIAELTGLEFTSPNPADITPTSVEIINLTGVSLSADIGSTTTDAMRVGLSGVTSTVNVGAITPTNMTVGLTGQAFTASLQTVGFGQIGYQDVDITGNTSYTDVNHAA